MSGDRAHIKHEYASLIWPAKMAEKTQVQLLLSLLARPLSGKNEGGGTLVWTPRKVWLADGEEGEGFDGTVSWMVAFECVANDPDRQVSSRDKTPWLNNCLARAACASPTPTPHPYSG